MSMRSMTTRTGDEGSAFVISVLVLFVMSVLGLALMLTTSTEKEIAINYRWGEQAFFNARRSANAPTSRAVATTPDVRCPRPSVGRRPFRRQNHSVVLVRFRAIVPRPHDGASHP